MEKESLNVPGKYHVDREACLACDACCDIAPNNFRYDTETGSTYVFKQPENQKELKECNEAVWSCGVEAVRDDGVELG